jgi:predicted ester cyclase
MSAQDHARRSAETLAAVRRMEDGLAAGENDMTRYFHDDFLWRGNQGCGTKHGVAEFRRNWQLPIRAAFTDRDYKTEKFLADGEWAACFGHIEATHSGTFMGIAPTGKRVTIPYMDFWRVEDGRIADNPVSVDFASVMAQLGVDVFAGKGWETYDRGEETPPAPEVTE